MYFGHFFKLMRKCRSLWLFFHSKIFVLILDKKWVGQHFGRFFKTNSSGRTASERAMPRAVFCKNFLKIAALVFVSVGE
jgi:hypothetical protein